MLDSWQRLLAWLAEHAPAELPRLQAPVDPPAVLARELGVALSPDAREFFAVQGGGLVQVLPFQRTLSTSEAVRDAQMRRDVQRSTERWVAGQAWGPDLASQEQERSAQERAPAGGAYQQDWLDAFVPLSSDGSGDCFYVDCRGGPQSGCVGLFVHDDVGPPAPVWSGVAAMLADAAEALEQRRPSAGWWPYVDEGELGWSSGPL